jgi:hypothetical protein
VSVSAVIAASRRRGGGGGGGAPSLVQAPEISGVKQARQYNSTYGGEYSVPPTHIRYTLSKINPTTRAVVGSPAVVVQSVAALGLNVASVLPGQWADADAYYDQLMLVEASFDNQATYPISNAAIEDYSFDSDVVLPWTIPDHTVAFSADYVPGSGTLKLDFTGIFFSCNRILVAVLDKTRATLKGWGEIAVSEAMRTGFSLDFSGLTDPAITWFVDPTGTILDTDHILTSQTTPGYQFTGVIGKGGAGSTSEWVAISATMPANTVPVRVRIKFTTVSGNGFTPRIAVTGSLLSAPANPSVTTSTSGGSLTAGTYYYKITALGFTGETVGSVEVSQTTTGSSSKNSLKWDPVPGAEGGYRIYRGTSAGAESVYYSSSVTNFTDIGATATAGSVPGVGTARPDIIQIPGPAGPEIGVRVTSSFAKDNWDAANQQTPIGCLLVPPHAGNIYHMFQDDYIDLDTGCLPLTGATLSIAKDSGRPVLGDLQITKYAADGTNLGTVAGTTGLTYTSGTETFTL